MGQPRIDYEALGLGRYGAFGEACGQTQKLGNMDIHSTYEELVKDTVEQYTIYLTLPAELKMRI